MVLIILKILGKIIISIILIAGVLALGIYIDDKTVGTTKYTIISENLPQEFDSYKIMLISDFHNSDFENQISKKIAKYNPDIIVLAGDIFDMNQTNYENVIKLINEISNNDIPAFFVTGNHEEWLQDKGRMNDIIAKSKLIVINDKMFEIKNGDSSIQICGLQDPIRVTEKVDTKRLNTVLKKLSSKDTYDNQFRILVSHRPQMFEYIKNYPFNVVLAGHNHGGQIRIPFVGGVIDGDGKLWPQYTKGLYTENNSTMVLSSGANWDSKNFRVLNSPEVVLLTLKNH